MGILERNTRVQKANCYFGLICTKIFRTTTTSNGILCEEEQRLVVLCIEDHLSNSEHSTEWEEDNLIGNKIQADLDQNAGTDSKLRW